MNKCYTILSLFKLNGLFLLLVISLSAFGQLIEYNKFGYYPKDSLKIIWKQKNIPRSIVNIKHGITIYRVKYFTKWIDGNKIIATGSMFVPDNSKKNPLLVYNHGTRIKKGAPKKLSGENILAMMFSTDGYYVISPDFIGLGEGEKSHLYCHIESEADAGIDFIRSSKEILSDLGKPATSELYITGYSQGGHAALAQLQVLERDFPNFKVKACSPMSGPYDLGGVQEEVMYHPYPFSAYLPYLLKSLNTAYDLFSENRFYNIFKPPYDSVARYMYNGQHRLRKINEYLPEKPVDMIQEGFVKRYKNDPDFELRKLLLINALSNWSPKTPTQLCYCEGDKVVPFENSIVTYENMKKLGSKDVFLKSGGKKFDHYKCAGTSTVYTKFFFDRYVYDKRIFKKGPLLKRGFLSLYKIFN